MLAGILVLVAAGTAIAGGWKRFAHGTAVGPGAFAEAGDVVNNPHRLMARITAEPNQVEIGAKYSTTCAKGTSISTRGRKFRGLAPVKPELRMRFSDPDACRVSVLAATEGHGRVTIDLFVRK